MASATNPCIQQDIHDITHRAESLKVVLDCLLLSDNPMKRHFAQSAIEYLRQAVDAACQAARCDD